MEVPQKATLAFDDPEAMCRAALLSLGVTLIAVPHALPHLETGALVRLIPQWYSDAGPISIYYATAHVVTSQNARLRRFRSRVISAQPTSGALRRKSRLDFNDPSQGPLWSISSFWPRADYFRSFPSA